MASLEGFSVEYRFENFLLDTERGLLLRDDEEVPLRRQSYEVLVHLVENSGRLVTREELLKTVWAGKVVTDASITQCLVDIRAALDDAEHEKIRTLTGRGYRFELPVEREKPSPGAMRDNLREPITAHERISGYRPKRRPAARLTIFLVVLVALAVGWVATDRVGTSGQIASGPEIRDSTSSETATPQAAATAGQRQEDFWQSLRADKSIIVLPFKDLSRDGDQAHLAHGIAEELLNLLAQIEQLRVISRTTSWTFMGRDVDVGDIHRMLDVSHILEGSVRKSGDRVRITVQLIDARTDSHIWSDTFDRTLGDVFAIQDEISASVADQLKLDLFSRPPTSDSIDPLAYELYLKGRHLTHTVRTQPAFEEAVMVLSKAVAMEPEYVPALWCLARALWNTRPHKSPSEREAVEARIHELVNTMAELEPESHNANAWLAFFAEFGGDFQAAALYYERAVAGRGDSDMVIHQAHAARFLGRLGRTDEALAFAHYVVNRDPACSWCVSNLFDLYLRAGRPREAAQELEKLLEWREPSTRILEQLSFAWLAAGEPAKALELVESSGLEVTPTGRVVMILTFHALGRQDEFEKAFENLSLRSDFPSKEIAIIAAQTGQNDLAFEALDRAIEINGTQLQPHISAIDDYLFSPIKPDPRWRLLLESHGIEDMDLSMVRFNPEFPPEVVTFLAMNEEGQ